MQNEESALAWVLFWLFAVITTVATFLIVDHHRSRLFALGMTAVSAAFFIGLYFALRFLLRYLGL